jgi:hypothetical protein
MPRPEWRRRRLWKISRPTAIFALCDETDSCFGEVNAHLTEAQALAERLALCTVKMGGPRAGHPVTIYAEPDHRVIARVAANAKLERPDSLDSPLAV